MNKDANPQVANGYAVNAQSAEDRQKIYVRITSEPERHFGYIDRHQLRDACLDFLMRKTFPRDASEPHPNIQPGDRLVIDGKRTYIHRTVHSGEAFDLRIREATEKDREFLEACDVITKLFND